MATKNSPFFTEAQKEKIINSRAIYEKLVSHGETDLNVIY